MGCLVDTNVLIRLIVVHDPLSQPARAAVDQLQQNGTGLLVTPQNLIEFWAVATRPVAVNGLRLSVEKTGEEVARFEEMFRLVDEPQGVFRRWRQGEPGRRSRCGSRSRDGWAVGGYGCTVWIP